MKSGLAGAVCWSLLLAGACGGSSSKKGGVSPIVSATVASAAQACADMPMPTTGTIHYACDCQSGADSSCQPGNDSNPGTDPSKPWQTYDKLQNAFLTMPAGDTVAFCRGGAFTGDTKNSWVNANCKAGTPCTVRDYTPPWGSSTLAAPRITGGSFNLNNNGNATHEEGYNILNLYVDGGPGYTIGVGLAIGNDITDVFACNLSLTNFQIGMFNANSNPPNSGSDGKNARITLRGSQVFNNRDMGYLGACTDCALEYNVFDTNGGADLADHDVYVQGASDGNGNHYITTGERIVGNELYHSAQGTGTSCYGDPLVVHGQHDNMLIANNTISQDLGTALGSCWGISVTKGYATPEIFTNITISGNVVENVGNIGIMVAYCQNCVIENNLVIQGQTDFNSTGIQAHYNGSIDSTDSPMNAVQILNNTIYFQTTTADSVGITVGQQGTNHVIANNVILGSTPNMLHCLDYDLSPSAYYSDYNVCWNLGGSVTAWEFTSNDDLTTWQTKSGLDQHSMTADPMLKMAALTNYDFSPAVGSPLIGAATSAHCASVDLSGNQRPSPSDIGAIEH
jgi:parallel beta-helix repeat protein